MNSDVDSSDFNRRYLGVTSSSISEAVYTPFFRSHQSLPGNQTDPLPPPSRTHLLPAEILSEIFLYTVQGDPQSQGMLMLVCRRWRGIMLSTPGIHSKLKIRKSTEEKHVMGFIEGRSRLDITVHIDEWEFEKDFNPRSFYASFAAASQVASIWRSIEFISLPYTFPFSPFADLRILQPLQHLESFKLARGCHLGSFLVPLMTAITTTATPRLTAVEVADSDVALYLLQPTHFHMFSCLTTLRIICKRMDNSVDILPHLKHLKTFEAHHLFLPIYPSDVALPLIQTLHDLHLRSVSVQWMAGQTFPALQKCSIIFPHHIDTITFQHVIMPSCSVLTYDFNDLGPLMHFCLPPLVRLDMKSGQCTNSRGNLQLANMGPIITASALSLTCLHLHIMCSEWLLIHVLGLVPALEELWLGLTSPRALSTAFFLAFVAGGPNASATIGKSSHIIAPLCGELKRLHLHYKRWLRGSEAQALIPAFAEIVASHHLHGQSSLSVQLSFDEGYKGQVWKVHAPGESFVLYSGGNIEIGFPGSHGMITLSSNLQDEYIDFPHFRELVYISIFGHWERLFFWFQDFSSFHRLRELRVPYSEVQAPVIMEHPPNLPLFHTLEVLHVGFIPSPLLAGQTFHKLKRYKESTRDEYYNRSQCQLTEMPVCTRLEVALSRLAALKLPQVHELSVFRDDKESNWIYIWQTHVVVNANLSGLKLLELRHISVPKELLIQILETLPALETLLVEMSHEVANMNFIEAIGIVNTQGTKSRLDDSSEEGQILDIICPRLEILHIEAPGVALAMQPDLMAGLNGVVTLRATLGSPLKRFTLLCSYENWELIGEEGSFIAKKIPYARLSLVEI